MEIAAFVITLATGFALGLYISTQIGNWIDKNSKK
jgi:ABC-type dipeptide/oligopeptide/nickel transport system permease component